MTGKTRHITVMVVSILFTTIALYSCSDKLPTVEGIALDKKPSQVVRNMVVSQKENGVISVRMEASVMERYDVSSDTTYEYFPDNFAVYAYKPDGSLETELTSNYARHSVESNDETWAAYGNVVVKNYIKGEIIETDTIYWDKEKKKIFTDCYVKLYSPQGMMQGYGLESDERASNATLLQPFDSYGIIERDSTRVIYLDSANFIGPMQKKVRTIK